MKKIEANFAELIKKQPEKTYPIVVVFNPEIGIEHLKLEKYNQIMDNIMSIRLTGNEIIRLSDDKTIISIEQDMEMGII